MLQHQRLRLRRGFLLLVKAFSAALLALVVIVLFAWLLLPSTSAPPFWAFLLLGTFCIYWGRGFDKRPDANVRIEWQFSKEEIKTQTELGEATIQWKTFLRVVETGEGFLFYPLTNIFHWLPFSAFESAACIERVRGFVRENDISLVGPFQQPLAAGAPASDSLGLD